MTYQSLLSETSRDGVVCETPLPEKLRLEEIEIQSHWFAGHFSDRYRNNHNQEVHIISPGEWNHGAGPDFLAATVEINGEVIHGPIELDLEARNWEHHGHSNNELFNDVILQVALRDPGPTFFTRTSEHREIPRIIIPEADVKAALGLPRLAQALARPGRCLTPLDSMTDEAVDSLLRQAATHRAQQKSKRFLQTSNLHGFSQALWEAFADSLGFAANRLPMRLLAQRLPIRVLSQHDPETAEAILFGTAGWLSPDLHESAPADSQDWLESLWKTWWKHRHSFEFPQDRLPSWQIAGSRPGNHPQRRLAALAAALSQWKSLVALSRQNPPFTKFTDSLGALSHDFWDHHHTLHSKKTPKKLRLLGDARLNEFLINTVYPVAMDKDNTVWQQYSKIRGGTPNQKVKRCCERLFGSLVTAKPYLKFAWQHQALLQVYQDFCLEDASDCQKCPFPEQLSQFS